MAAELSAVDPGHRQATQDSETLPTRLSAAGS
jgi:hypothetical protein